MGQPAINNKITGGVGEGRGGLQLVCGQSRRAALEQPAIKLLGGGGGASTSLWSKQKSRLGTASNKITGGRGGGGGGGGGGLQLVCGRQTLALSSALVPQTLSCSVCLEDS